MTRVPKIGWMNKIGKTIAKTIAILCIPGLIMAIAATSLKSTIWVNAGGRRHRIAYWALGFIFMSSVFLIINISISGHMRINLIHAVAIFLNALFFTLNYEQEKVGHDSHSPRGN